MKVAISRLTAAITQTGLLHLREWLSFRADTPEPEQCDYTEKPQLKKIVQRKSEQGSRLKSHGDATPASWRMTVAV